LFDSVIVVTRDANAARDKVVMLMRTDLRGHAHFTLAPLTWLTVACSPSPPAARPPAHAPESAPAHAAAPAAPAPAPRETRPETVASDYCLDGTQASSDERDELATGYLDPKVVQNVVQGGYFSMRECYEEGLARDTELTGKVQVRFVIGSDGRVSSAHLDDSTLPDCEAARCMLEVYRKLEFPEPNGGGVAVVYPITFTPS
jgi:TonB family protein